MVTDMISMVKTGEECKVYAGNKELINTDCNLNVLDMSGLEKEIQSFDPENTNLILEKIKNEKIDIYGDGIYFGYDIMLKFEINQLKSIEIRGEPVSYFIKTGIPNDVTIHKLSFIGKGDVKVLLSVNIESIDFPAEVTIPYSKTNTINEFSNIVKNTVESIMKKGYVPREISFSKNGYTVTIAFVVYDCRGVTTLTVGLINGEAYSENESFISVAEEIRDRIKREMEVSYEKFKRLLG